MSNHNAFEKWLSSVDAKQAGVLATVLQTDYSINNMKKGRMFIPNVGEPAGDLGSNSLNLQVIELAYKKMNDKNAKSETLTLPLNDTEVNVFVDVYSPPIELIIFGAGHDAIPVAQQSVLLGMETIVVDSRSQYNTEKRFPETTRILTKPEDLNRKVNINNQSFVIIMNHHLEKDIETLLFALNSVAAYIGVLGPLSRCERMLDKLKAAGNQFNERQLERIHSPVGLDIGSDSLDEIALSILSEVIAVKKGFPGGFLKGQKYISKAR